MKRSWYCGDYKITLREILASISIIAIMLIIGFTISGKISAYQMERDAEYYKAAKITDTNMFQYGMDTSLGNAFVYGELEAVDLVTFPEIGGEYLYAKKVEEHYNMHTRTVTYTDSKGKSQTKTEIYWSWDYAGSEEIHSQKIRFCGIEMDYVKISMPSTDYIKTIMKSSNVRFKYYVCKQKHMGTIYTDLRDGSIKDRSNFYQSMDIESTVDCLVSGIENWLFWGFWIVLTGCSVFGFLYMDNTWLED